MVRWTAAPDVWLRERTKRRFLLLPKCIGGQWRWLEWATWRERHCPPTELRENGWWEAAEWIA